MKDYPKINGPMNSFNNRSAREEVKSAPSAYGTIHTANIDLEKPLARVTLKERYKTYFPVTVKNDIY